MRKKGMRKEKEGEERWRRSVYLIHNGQNVQVSDTRGDDMKNDCRLISNKEHGMVNLEPSLLSNYQIG